MDESHLDPTQPAPRTEAPRTRFLPGAVLAERYRIVAPLGRGGMGEVYRADDLKLGAPVALKFLPPGFEAVPERLAMLLDEVRLARQVSHRNVCRVWDTGESDGLHFVSMEFVDGEDLASLLRRIGRLPEERGIQIAREICAGLAAIHEQGLLHRDLKPSNILIDGRGRARIADFGLAAAAGTIAGAGVRSGTPAYMAPEQIEGRGVTERSDIYALGLVLYELFTGRYAFESSTVASARASGSIPAMTSGHLRTLDPVIERAILRCLDPDALQRPSSALAVSGAFPGGDPVMAALAAGETPSPDMVAASGGVGGLAPWVAAALVAAILVGLAALLLVADRRGLPFGPEDKPYVALRERAADFLRDQGIARQGEHVADGFSRLGGRRTPPGARSVYYWYRRAANPVPVAFEERNRNLDNGFSIPVPDQPGERALRFDLRGRLLEFRRIPSPEDPTSGVEPDWRPYLSAAGLGTAASIDTTPAGILPFVADHRRAWMLAGADGPLRVEGASFRGRVTYFLVGAPIVIPASAESEMIATTVTSLIPVVLLVLMFLLARRNLLAGRADVRGAIRISALMGATGYLGYNLFTRQVQGWPGVLLVLGVQGTVFFGLLNATAYLALEPIVRRRHPEWLASWSRLLEGRWSDRLIGRDVLVGMLVGVLAALAGGVFGLLNRTIPAGDLQAAAIGGFPALAVALRGINDAVLIAMISAILLALLLGVSRWKLPAWGLWILVVGMLGGAPGSPRWLITLIQYGTFGFVLVRFGLVGMISATVVHAMLNEEYLTAHLGAWYAGVTTTSLVLIGVAAVWAAVAASRTTRPSDGTWR